MSKQDRRSTRRNQSIRANYMKWTHRERHPNIDFVMDEQNCDVWWVRMHGFTGNTDEYKGGEYIVEMRAPCSDDPNQDYPFGPPQFYFKTPNGVYECDRKVCISIGEYHKDNYAAAQGGMGGFALRLLTSFLMWRELGTGISIMHPEYHKHMSDEHRRVLDRELVAEKRRYAAASRAYNDKNYAARMRQFADMPSNRILAALPTLDYAPAVTRAIRMLVCGSP